MGSGQFDGMIIIASSEILILEKETEELEQKAKKIVEAADSIINNTQNFATFMRAGYQLLNAATRQFLIDTCIFDLKYLSDDGFIDLQNHIDTMNEMILEDLHEIFQD